MALEETMKYFDRPNSSSPFPHQEARILRSFGTIAPSTIKTLAEQIGLKYNQVSAWVSILRQRSQVRNMRRKAWSSRATYETWQLELTELGRQRLAFLDDNEPRPSTCSSGKANKTSTIAAVDARQKTNAKISEHVAGDLDRCLKGSKSRPPINGARAAGGRRQQMTSSSCRQPTSDPV